MTEQQALVNWCRPDSRAQRGPNAYLFDDGAKAYRSYESRRIPCPHCKNGTLDTPYDGGGLQCRYYRCKARVDRASLPLAPGERLWINDFTPFVVRPRD
ncbi:hypothetical protein ACFYZ8_33435 [Streptomyces sp. NPDC001668]|uniref:hypothetical protein n=1 Tax=Streptomyces sp. NPDC001668 TaxID=3364598 RepID=UPI0036C01A06